jgi:hypothetical protein
VDKIGGKKLSFANKWLVDLLVFEKWNKWLVDLLVFEKWNKWLVDLLVFG